MLGHPEDRLSILTVPGVSAVAREEAPVILIIVIWKEGVNTSHATLGKRYVRSHVFLPYDGQEERAGTVHDREVRNVPVAVVGCKGVDHPQEERVSWNRPHNVVADANW